jgi:IclR family pca regulon transcriptional regulator
MGLADAIVDNQGVAMSTGARAPHFVRSFERGLAVIRSFDAEHPARTLSEVARRLLLTLVDLGYVHCDGRLFRLTPRVLELGYAYLAGLTLPQLAQPHLEQLVAEVRESSSLCVLDGDDIVYVARVPTRRLMSATITVGTRFPAHVTSVGRVMLADLPEEELDARLARTELRPLTARTLVSPGALRAELDRVRRQGYALVDQELEEGPRTGVNIAVHAGRTSLASVRRELLPHLLAAVARIEADLRVTHPEGSPPGLTDPGRASSPGTATRRSSSSPRPPAPPG